MISTSWQAVAVLNTHYPLQKRVEGHLPTTEMTMTTAQMTQVTVGIGIAPIITPPLGHSSLLSSFSSVAVDAVYAVLSHTSFHTSVITAVIVVETHITISYPWLLRLLPLPLPRHFHQTTSAKWETWRIKACM